MLHTAEVRWFVAGSMPARVREWFWQGTRPRQADVRIDRYLVLAGCESVGVKLRSGATLDVKGRIGDGVAVHYPSMTGGVRERWVKWACSDGDAVGGLATATSGDGRWLDVRKERCLRFFSLDALQPVELGPADGGGIGCHVELTDVQLASGSRIHAWTIAFEASGTRDRLDEALDATAASFLSARPAPPVPLERSGSMGYPAWLNRVLASGSGAPRG